MSRKHSSLIFRVLNEISSADRVPQCRMKVAHTDKYKDELSTLKVLCVTSSCNMNNAPISLLFKSMLNVLKTSINSGEGSLTNTSLVDEDTGTIHISL